MLPDEDKARFYSGDILLTPQQREILTEMEMKQSPEGGVEKRAVVRTLQDLWPNGVVPYTISSQLSKGKVYTRIFKL